MIGVVTPAQSGMASGMNTTFRQVGIATGIAGLGAIFQHQIHQSIQASLGASAHATNFAQAVAAGAGGQVIAHAPIALRPSLVHAQQTAFTSALNDVFLVGALVAVAGALATLLLIRGRDLAVAAPHPPPAPPDRRIEPSSSREPSPSPVPRRADDPLPGTT